MLILHPCEVKKPLLLDCNIQMTARNLASIVGLLVSTTRAILPAPLHYRSLQRQLAQATALGNTKAVWETQLELNTDSLEDIQWWNTSIRNHNGRPIIIPEPSLTIETDASKLGWGAVMGNQKAQGRWTAKQSENHNNYLELLGIQEALAALAGKLRNIHIKILTDNTTAMSIINHMGSQKHLHLDQIAKNIWNWCIYRRITITAAHIPGVKNTEADAQSRKFRDMSDWQLERNTFLSINKKLSPDLVASSWNHQLPRFYSWKPQPNSLGIDALQQEWDKSGNYAFPPFSFIQSVIRIILMKGIHAIVVTPLWPSQTWYSNLV